MKKVIIIGSGGHAKVCIDILKKSDEYFIEGLIDDFRSVGEATMGIKVIGNISEVWKYKETHSFFIAVGDNYNRFLIAHKLKELELNYINIIDPSAVIANDVLNTSFGITRVSDSVGVVIMPGVVINAGTYIGNHVILNTGTTIDHDNVLNDFSSVGPGVHTGGNVHIGRSSHIGIGASVCNLTTIGEHTVIGAGSMVKKFVSAYKTAYGVPCKEIRDRAKGDKYL